MSRTRQCAPYVAFTLAMLRVCGGVIVTSVASPEFMSDKSAAVEDMVLRDGNLEYTRQVAGNMRSAYPRVQWEMKRAHSERILCIERREANRTSEFGARVVLGTQPEKRARNAHKKISDNNKQQSPCQLYSNCGV